MTEPANSANLYKNILMAVLSALFVAVIGSYVAQAAKMDSIAKDAAEARDIAGQALRTTARIEGRLKTMDDAAVVAATEERDRLKAQVLDLQQRSYLKPGKKP